MFYTVYYLDIDLIVVVVVQSVIYDDPFWMEKMVRTHAEASFFLSCSIAKTSFVKISLDPELLKCQDRTKLLRNTHRANETLVSLEFR